MGTAERRERERQQRIDLIMDAALEVFAEKGLKNATMDDVAEKAELSKGTIYNYFKSKEHLFFAIDLRAGLMLKERFAEAARSEKLGLRKVRAIGRAYYQFCFDYPNYFKAMSYVESLDAATFMKVADEMLPSGLKGYVNASLTILVDAIKKGQEDGSIAKDVDPMLTSVLLWSTSNGVISMIKKRDAYFEYLGVSVEDFYRAKERMVERGLGLLPSIEEDN